jgi:hypothetical protein
MHILLEHVDEPELQYKMRIQYEAGCELVAIFRDPPNYTWAPFYARYTLIWRQEPPKD